ncbi:ATP-binding protein [Uliginosibacterium sp. H3]|uniref:histidine kinase n=1 Tax=Uliginosibacterium silvisoli TaxID=3114758 RepID=A0ABU6K050_9RHOO|nr:ATP-binding protein [Uliginosibacterium sp. H3]
MNPDSPRALEPRSLSARLRPWLFVLLAVVVSMGITLALRPIFGPRAFIIAFPAVIIVALFVGVTHAMFTAVGCVLWVLVSQLYHPPPLPADVAAIASFLALSFLLATLCGLARTRARQAGAQQALQPRGDGHTSLPRTALVNWLTASMYAAVVLPATFFVGASWYAYERATDQASLEVERANRMADQLLQNSFRTNLAALDRLKALVGTTPDFALKMREKELHEHLVELAAGRADTQAIWIWGANGRAVATNRFYPVPQDTVITDREYFRVHQRGEIGLYISDILFGRISNEHFFNISARRNYADGTFGGIVSVSMYPSFFANTYATMARDMKDLTITLAREDGKILARWPSSSPLEGKAAVMSNEAMQAIAGKAATGMFSHISPVDGEKRLVSFRKVGPWPLYVYAGLSYREILTDWYRDVLVLAGFTLTTAIGLIYVSWVALRLTRREQLAQVELQSENARRLQAEDALLQAQKLEALGQITGGVAHDVNNLLMVIGTNTHVHRMMQPHLPADNAQLAAIDRSVAAGAKLTRQLLSFSRKQTVAPEVIHLQTQLLGLLDLVRTSLGGGIELTMDVAADTRLVVLDLVELELALINLALNARDAMQQGEVRITACNGRVGDIPAAPTQECVVVRFSDKGAGVSPDNIERLFEPFFTTKPPGKGTGLGLSQVYGFCVQAGGTARIESTLGEGTCVSMYFPVALEAGHTPKPVQPLAVPRKLSGHVLLVEDNEEVGTSTMALLKSLGLTAYRVASADEAKNLLHEAPVGHFDAVLSDIFMPGTLDGIDLALRLQRDAPDLPVILMTGYAAEEHKAVAAGLRVLSKPFSPDLLADALGRVLTKLATAAKS